MSYSFTVRAATKAEALFKVAAEIEKIAASQPSHEIDKAHAVSLAESFAGFIDDTEGMDVVIALHGSLGWQGTWGGDDGVVITSASVGVNAYLVKRDPAA